MMQRVFKASLQLFEWFGADADSQQPAGDAAVFDEIQFGVMRQDRVWTAERKICPQIRAFAHFQMIKHHRRGNGRISEYER